MKSSEIIIGGVYMAKVSGRVVPVRVIEKRERWHPRPAPHGTMRDYWVCRSEMTGRTIEVKSSQRFRSAAAPTT